MEPLSLTDSAGAVGLSKLLFGCASIGGRIGRAEGLRALALAFDQGINGFDTARSYGYGESERILGEFLKGKRERVFLSTKCGIATFAPTPGLRIAKDLVRKVFDAAPALRRLARSQLGKQHKPGLFTPLEIRRSVEQSLRELDTDRIDVLFLHDVTAEAGVDPEVTAALESLKQEGKILRYGASGAPAILAELCASSRVEQDALQYPCGLGVWNAYPAGFPPPPGKTRLRLGNQPFQGAQPLAPLRSRLESAFGAPLSDRELRELLIRAPLVTGACDVVVTSMFSPQHLAENIRSVTQPSLDAEQIRSAATALEKPQEFLA